MVMNVWDKSIDIDRSKCILYLLNSNTVIERSMKKSNFHIALCGQLMPIGRRLLGSLRRRTLDLGRSRACGDT